MVNQCCVSRCGRKSSKDSYLNFFSFPKERRRKLEWLSKIDREDLIPLVDTGKLHHRICSRHFSPARLNKYQLPPDAMPSKHLPNSTDKSDDDKSGAEEHQGIICDNCTNPMVGFRYKCLTCDDYDLCMNCEMKEIHKEHLMIRLPRPIKFNHADNLTKEVKKVIFAHVPLDISSNSDSSDDEPIIKKKVIESRTDLNEDIKQQIRNEVNRVLHLTQDQLKSSRKPKRNEEQKQSKISKINSSFVNKNAPEMVFADVQDNNMDDVTYIKTEFPHVVETDPHGQLSGTSSSGTGSGNISHVPSATSSLRYSVMNALDNQEVQPVTVTGNTVNWTGDEKAELMIEVTDNQKLLYYKYN